MPHSTWDDRPDAVELLITAHKEGDAYSLIQRRLLKIGFETTRSACIGKARRLGLEKRAPASGGGRNHLHIRKPKKPKTKPKIEYKTTNRARDPLMDLRLDERESALKAAQESDARAIPAALRVPLLIRDGLGRLTANEELAPSSCRWPIGDPQDADFGFCGCTSVPGLSYCESHAARAWPGLTPVRQRDQDGLCAQEIAVDTGEPAEREAENVS